MPAIISFLYFANRIDVFTAFCSPCYLIQNRFNIQRRIVHKQSKNSFQLVSFVCGFIHHFFFLTEQMTQLTAKCKQRSSFVDIVQNPTIVIKTFSRMDYPTQLRRHLSEFRFRILNNRTQSSILGCNFAGVCTCTAPIVFLI